MSAVRSHPKVSPDYIGYGSEDTIPSVMFDNATYIRALSFYNYFYDTESVQQFVHEFMAGRYSDQEIEVIKKTNPFTVGLVSGSIARMLNNNCVLPDHAETFLVNRINSILKNSEELSVNYIKPKSAIAQRNADRNSDVIAEIEEAIDTFTTSGMKSTFKAYEFFKSRNVNGKLITAIYEKYKGLSEDLHEVLQKTDAELTAAYRSVYSMQAIRKYYEFICDILKDCDSIIVSERNEKAIKKEEKKAPAKRNSKNNSATKKAPKVKPLAVDYMKENNELKLVSVPPSKIIGAQMAWLYRVTQKQLVMVVASDPMAGLAFKGSTIIGFDEAKSIGKRVSSPATIQSIATSAKTKGTKEFMDLPFAKLEISGRVNSGTLILKTF